MSYYKKIEYIDYYDGGEKKANAGFVKIVRNGTVCLQVNITNFPVKEFAWGRVVLTDGVQSAELGGIKIANWRGMLRVEDLQQVIGGAMHQLSSDKPEGSAAALSNHDHLELYLEIDGARMLKCKLPALDGKEEKNEEELSDIGEAAGDIDEFASDIDEFASDIDEFASNMEEAASDIEAAEEKLPVWEADVAVPESPEPDRSIHMPAAEGGKEHRQDAWRQKLAGDKWRQLENSLPHIAPFQDDREYLQMTLQDLVILPKQFYRLVENSFLLHGYYNYEHLILTKEYKKGAERFFVGVPGNYYEREKQVAVLFGFESFEPKAEPAKEGDFGYYMIGVEI